MKLCHSLTLLFILVALSSAFGQGKHLEIMAPLSQRNQLSGSPESVIEKHLESSADGKLLPTFTTVHLYDTHGNGLLYEKYNLSNAKLESRAYGYDSEGTWISLREQTGEGILNVYPIMLRSDSNQVARVDRISKKTKLSTYNEKGFKTLSVTQISDGQIEEKETTKRNSANQKELLTVERPAGNKLSKTEIEWEEKGFQSRKTTSRHDHDGDRVVIIFSYPDTDNTGNWLTRIATRVAYKTNGDKVSLPTETTRRSITYH